MFQTLHDLSAKHVTEFVSLVCDRLGQGSHIKPYQQDRFSLQVGKN